MSEVRKFHDGHNVGVVDLDPWDGRIVLEWSYDDTVQTRVTWSPVAAEEYAKAILEAVQEARR